MSVNFPSTVGVNFSNTFQSTPVSATDAATQIAALGTKMVKTYNYTQTDFIKEAKANGLKVILGIPNDHLEDLSKEKPTTTGDTAKKQPDTESIIVDVIKKYSDTIIMVCVGNEPLGPWWGGAYSGYLAKAVQNLNAALIAASVPTPLTVPFNYAIMSKSYPPSKGAIHTSLTATIESVCAVIKSSGGVFMINIYPFLNAYPPEEHVTLKYCLFTATKAADGWPPIDGAYQYKNIFDASYDALFMALTTIGYGDLNITIGECGWPTGPSSNAIATLANATTFNTKLVAHCKSGTGTPRVSGKINCFIFEMYDEDTKSIAPGEFEKHWGVYKADGTTKHPAKYTAKYTLSL
ncbi:MAG: hypothetical protein JKY02_02195 [Flavobacteriaceae bacterium]|nr:hypothetical protein [Flavobacteriaceae bacterium]